MAKIILVGYPGSQHIVPVSRYLVEKYLPRFDVIYLNYEGEISGWSKFCADYLETLEDEKVIFSLDDYLVSGADLTKLRKAFSLGPCVKLCRSTPKEDVEYPVTTQYTVWDRILLIDILLKTTSPWDFEVNGSKLFTDGETSTCVYYDVHTALSKRWEGVKLDGLSYEDINYIINNKLL